MTATEILQKVQLVKGEFTPFEASDIIRALIREKINFHEMQRLRMWEGDHNCNTNPLDGRIGELVKEKEHAMKIISEARKKGYNLQINGTLEITFTEPADTPADLSSSDN